MTGPQGIFQCPLLSCNDSWQLAEFSACLVPHIWTGRLMMEFITPISSTTAATTLLRRSTSTSTNVFKQFCHKIFKHTQISSGCILLALYYLQQLKSIYPTLRGTLGSEFRIFTTALILANKYLDDNTFTNKTWSEVSGIPINELNIMEMEYLTALNYKLHVHCLRFCSWVNQCQQCFHTPTPILKRSTSTTRYSSQSHPYQYKLHHHSSSQRHCHKYHESIYPISHPSIINACGGVKKKKRNSVISPSQSCHTYLPTPPTNPILTIPSSMPISTSPSIMQDSCKTPMMSWSSSMPIIPHSGTTAAANAAAYVTYHHHYSHSNSNNNHYTISSNLVNGIRCLEID